MRGHLQLLKDDCIFTARVRSTTEGNSFTLFVSPHLGGGSGPAGGGSGPSWRGGGGGQVQPTGGGQVQLRGGQVQLAGGVRSSWWGGGQVQLTGGGVRCS